jgi:spore coat protein A, manganese oxidase
MSDYSRRRFLQYGLGAGAAIGFPVTAGRAVKAGQVPDAGRVGVAGPKLKRFAERLPVPGAGIVVASPRAPGEYAFTLRQIRRRLHSQLPPTPFWAYDDGSGLSGQAGSFGMAIVARTGTPLHVSYTHRPPAVYPSWIPVDTRLSESGKAVRILTHLHGGFVSGASDGNPELMPRGFGPGQTQTVFYPNQGPHQSARQMWFHDHADGDTRLNVFAGLAAAYIIRDSHDTGAEPNPIGLPGGRYEIPLVIQDRQFNPDGTFRYPVSDIPGVTWIGEYFGDVMLVNGKVWPYLEVEPRLYRFRVLKAATRGS